MIYYFVSSDGDHMHAEEYARGWFDEHERGVFTQKALAIAEAKRRLKARIAELKSIYEEMK